MSSARPVQYRFLKMSEDGTTSDPEGTTYESDGNFGLRMVNQGILPDPSIYDASPDTLFSSLGPATSDPVGDA